MSRPLRPDDEGKPIVTVDGERIGSVEQVRDGHAFVRAEAGLLAGCSSWLTGGWAEDCLYPLDVEAIDSVDRDCVRVDTADDGPVSMESAIQK